MVKISKRKTKKISTASPLGLDPHDPDDKAFIQFKDFIVALHTVMIRKEISKNELARRMKISRQAVYDKFSGRNLTMDWIQRACRALGVELQIRFVDKKKAA